MVKAPLLPFFGLLLLVIAPASSARAEDARVLPQGRSRFGVIYGATGGIRETYNNDGAKESVTAPYNIRLDGSALQKFDSKVGGLVDYLNSINLGYDPSRRNEPSHGVVPKSEGVMSLGDAFSRGDLGVNAEAHQKQYNLTYQYGVTDRLSVGLMVPYVQTRVRVNYGLYGGNAEDIFQALGVAGMNSTLDQGINLVRSLDIDTLQSELAKRGYDPFENYDGSGLGDVVLGGRYNAVNARTRSGEWISSVQFGGTVPSGKLKQPRQITAVDRGQGAWDAGAAHILNWTPSLAPALMLSSGQHYTYRFKSSRAMRVRNGPDDFAPDASTEENVDVWLGDKYWGNLGAQYKFTTRTGFEITPSLSYEWYAKKRNRYQGGRDKDYSYMAENTDAYSETLQAGVSFGAIPAYFQKQVPAPFELSLNYFWVTRGRNTLVAPYGTAELALYF